MAKAWRKFVCLAVAGVVAEGAPARQSPQTPGRPLPASAVPVPATSVSCLHDLVLQRLSASVEVMVALKDAARQRASPAGRAMTEALTASGSWGGTIRAWEALARTLDWTPARTFDEVLGKRASLILRGLDAADGPEWVVLTAVGSGTQHRLRERLRAAPRSAMAGLAVLSIEDGSFQLLVAPCPAATVRGLDSSLVLLAPRSSERLLEEVAPLLTAQATNVTETAAKDGDFSLSIRRAGSATPSLRLVARSAGNGWDASIVCEPSQIFGAGSPANEAARHAPVWGDSLFRDLEAGSLLGVLSLSGMRELPLLPEPLQSWKQVIASLADPARALTGGELRTGVFVRGVGPSSPGPVQAASSRSVAARNSFHDSRIEADTNSPRGRLSVTAMAETRTPRETLVDGDVLMTRVAGMLMLGEADSGKLAEGGVGGGVRFEIPLAGPRVIPLGEGVNGLPLHPSIEPTLHRAFGDQVSLSWRIMEPRVPGSTSWWVGSLAPTQDWSSRELRALSTPETNSSGRARRWLSLGSIRPRALWRWLEAIELNDVDFQEGVDPGAAARFFESVQWEAYLQDDNQIGATIRIRMAVDPSR